MSKVGGSVGDLVIGKIAELLAVAGSSNSLLPPQPQLEPERGGQERAASNDLLALAALSGQEVPGGHEIVETINVADREANFHPESCSDNSLVEEKNMGRRVGSVDGPRPPPGFGGQQQLQDILGQRGPGAPLSGMLQSNIQLQQQVEQEQLLHGGEVPGGITPEQLRKGGILPEQLRAGGISQEQLRTGEILPEQLRQGGILPEQLQAGGILLILPGQLGPPLTSGRSFPAFSIPSQDLEQRQVLGEGSTHQFDRSALATLSRQGEVPGGQEIIGIYNADEHTESSPGNNSLVEEKIVDRQADSAGRSGCQHQLQDILGPKELSNCVGNASDSVIVPVLDTTVVDENANKEDTEHAQTKSTAEKYSCQNCNKTFASLYWFQKHTMLCGHRLPCEKCNKTFKNLRCLSKHIKVNHGD